MNDLEPDDFEARRLANIRENQATLEKLGLSGRNVLGIPGMTSGSASSSKPKKRPRVPHAAKVTTEPSRKSRRLAASSSTSYYQDEDGSDTNNPQSSSLRLPVTALRRLTPPRPPAPTSDNFQYPPGYIAPSPTRDPCNVPISTPHSRPSTSNDAPESTDDSDGGGRTIMVGGTIHFANEPHFTPNLTPAEMIRLGSFGGTFFRAFHSTILNADIPEDYDEFPAEWYEALDIPSLLTRSEREYAPTVNRYGVKAGQSLSAWESAGWIRPQDPRGWFQWYCRFYVGRRTVDDERQIARWSGVCGPNGRFKKALVKKVVSAGGEGRWNDTSISPVVRQTLQHWGYILTEDDYEAFMT